MVDEVVGGSRNGCKMAANIDTNGLSVGTERGGTLSRLSNASSDLKSSVSWFDEICSLAR